MKNTKNNKKLVLGIVLSLCAVLIIVSIVVPVTLKFRPNDPAETTPESIVLNPNTSEVVGSVSDDNSIIVNDSTPIAAGSNIIVVNPETGMKEAYKVETVAQNNDGTSKVTTANEKPAIEEIYSKFVYSGDSKLTSDSKVNMLFDDAAAQASGIAEAAASIFNAAPQVGGNIEMLEDGRLSLTLTITLPDVVKLGSETTNLTITINDVISAEANTDINIVAADINYDVNILIKNNITCTVGIDTAYNYGSVTNVNEIIAKLKALSDESNQDDVEIPAFVWSIPIANGAASIDYQAAVVFRFDFAGAFNVEANATLDFFANMGYSSKTGFYSDSQILDNSGFNKVIVGLDGSAKVKVGLDQTLSLNILAGVLKAGVGAELGIYNDLYGSVKTGNLLVEDPTLAAGLYLDGGFYYNVDLDVAVGFSGLKLEKSFPLVGDKINLYEAGNRYITTGIEVENQYSLSGFVNKNLDITIVKYDLVTRQEVREAATAEDIIIADQRINFINNNLVIADSARNDEFTTSATIKFGQYEQDTTLEYAGNFIVGNSYAEFNKSDAAGAIFDIYGNGISSNAKITAVTEDGISLDIIASPQDNYCAAELSRKSLAKLDNGTHKITLSNGTYFATVEVKVDGFTKATDYVNANGYYEIFCRDQIIDIFTNQGTSEGKIYELTSDIDLGGATIKPLAEFRGTIYGRGYKISGYSVTSFTNNSAALIANNAGQIEYVVFDGNVNVSFSGSFKGSYKVSGVVANNNGVLVGVEFIGNVSVAENSLNAGITIRVGGVTTTKLDPIVQCDASNATLSINVKFDRAINVYYDSSIQNIDKECSLQLSIKDDEGVFVKYNKF